MDVTRLPVGEPAPNDADCLRIEELSDGRYKLTASALCEGAESAESVSIVDFPTFSSVQEAEDAGLAWADDVGSDQIFVTIGTLLRPLKPTEMDLPL